MKLIGAPGLPMPFEPFAHGSAPSQSVLHCYSMAVQGFGDSTASCHIVGINPGAKMADEPKPAPPSDDRPRFFRTLNGWIAGLTGVVLAFAGLFTACDKLFPDSPVKATTASNNAPAPTVATTAPKTDDSDPAKYTGEGGVTMDWDFDDARWILTDNGNKYYYDNITPPDDTEVLGYDKTNDAYLRWPLKGGLAQESKDDKKNWSDYVVLNPLAEVSPATAN